MKGRIALLALAAGLCFGCDDNTAGIGIDLLPQVDQQLSGRHSEFDVVTQSVASQHTYAKSAVGYVGRFADEAFGTYQAGFLAELNSPTGISFPQPYVEANGKGTGEMSLDANDTEIQLIYDQSGNPIGNVRAVVVNLWYKSYFGDGKAANSLSVYELSKPLEEANAYYTDTDFSSYLDTSKKLGTKIFSGIEHTLSDSIRKTSGYNPGVALVLDKEAALRVGTNIIRQARANNSQLNQELFKQVFPGVFVESDDYGGGTVLYVEQVQLSLICRCFATDSISGLKLKAKDGSDSVRDVRRPFFSTREVIQANRLQHDPTKLAERVADSYCTYLKSPTGIFTQATLPIDELETKLKNDTLNGVKLVFNCFENTGTTAFEQSLPTHALLIREKELDDFFRNNRLPDNQTSYLTSLSSNAFTFSNIAKLINTALSEKAAAQKAAGNSWNEASWKQSSGWDKVLLVPVSVGTEKTYSASQNKNIETVISVLHDLKPGFVKLKGGSAGATDANYRLKLEVTSTRFN